MKSFQTLDIFNIDIVEFLSIDKVYNNNFYGDIAGGNVDIISKDFAGDSYLKIDIGGNINIRAIDENKFPLNVDLKWELFPGIGEIIALETYQANFNRDITVMSYKKGMGISFSMSYKL